MQRHLINKTIHVFVQPRTACLLLSNITTQSRTITALACLHTPRGRMSTSFCSGLSSRLSCSRPQLTRQQQIRLPALQARSIFPQHQIRPMHGLPTHSRLHKNSWIPKAELAAGGGGSSGSGGKKGYSSGDSAGDGGLWGAYNRALEAYPLLVKAITTAILSAVGNLICQVVIEKKDTVDMRRLNIFTILGFVWVAPCLHFWFGALNRIVTATGNTGALLRMACDQLGFAPVFISSMIGILTVLDGKADRAIDTIKADLPSAITANWMLWVPAQFINFRFVPAQYQVLFANVVALAWNVYFSFATRPKGPIIGQLETGTIIGPAGDS